MVCHIIIGEAGLPVCVPPYAWVHHSMYNNTWHDMVLFSLHMNKLGPMIHAHDVECHGMTYFNSLIWMTKNSGM